MCGKPIKLIRHKADIEFESKVVAVIIKKMPELFQAHDLEVKKSTAQSRQKEIDNIKDEVITEIKGQLQNVDTLVNQYKALEISAKDVLREKIVCMYENNKDVRKLRHFEKRALDQYYKDYKAMKGNSYIDIIYERMKTWEVEPDDYE